MSKSKGRLKAAYRSDVRRQRERSFLLQGPKKAAPAIGNGTSSPEAGTVRTVFTAGAGQRARMRPFRVTSL